jgi:hypothetical protein
MGYTIYWEWRGCSLPLWHVVCLGVQALLQAAAARGIGCVATELSDAAIEFEGPVEQACESFRVDRSSSSTQCSCKTMLRAYDPVIRVAVMFMCDLGVAGGMCTDGAWDDAQGQQHAATTYQLLLAAGLGRGSRARGDHRLCRSPTGAAPRRHYF